VLRTKIEQLQQLQKHRLNGRPLSQLPYDSQIEFCRTNKEIGELAFQAYEQMQHDSPLEAARYFIVSLYNHEKKAVVIRHAESAKSISTPNSNDISPLETKEDTFKLGVCYLIGIGNYIQNKSIAFKLIKLAAEQGDVTAPNYLGVMYDEGEGVPKDETEAVKWYRLAAEQGHATAQFNLGVMYDEGEGAPKDETEAVKWYRLAAEQGYATAQYNLGVMYDEGEGVPKDETEAVKWYRLAAEQGYAPAQYNLGVMYEVGEGIPQDKAEAAKWFRLAAEQCDADAIKELSEKKNFSAIYHAAMLEQDEASVIKLLSGKNSNSEELLFDINRSVKNNVLFETVLSIISQLEEKGINTARYQSAINDVYIQRILAGHEEKNNCFEVYDDQSLQSLYSSLNKINFSNVAAEQIQPLLNLLIDSWYAATNFQFSSKINIKTTKYLSQLIYKLNSQSEPSLDAHTARQCSLILIKQHLGEQYEIAFKSLELNDLNLLLALIKSKKPVEQINKMFGENIIVEVSIDVIQSVITGLVEYLKNKVSTSPYFDSLNRLIKSNDNLSDERGLRDTLGKILIHTSEYHLIRKEMRKNTFFKTLELDNEAKGIYSLLRHKDLKGLKQFLEDNKKRLEAGDQVYSPSSK